MTEVADKPAAAVQAPRPVAASPAAAAPATVTPPVVPPPHVQVRAEPRRPGKFRRFVRSVFSHLIFAALVTAGVFGYVYQDMILGRVATTVCGNDALGPYAPGGSKAAAANPAVTAAPVKAASAPAKAADTKPAGTSEPAAKVVEAAQAPSAAPAATISAPPAKSQPSTPEPAKSDITTPAPAPALAKTSPPAVAPASPSAVVAAAPTATAAPTAAAPTTPTAAKPAESVLPAIEKSAPTPVATPAQAPPANAPAQKSPAATAAPASQDALAAAWRAAREAFNAGKPDAIDAYKALLRSYPDVPDLAGELGNIYYAAGKWREASEHYYEAAQRYLKSPQPDYAACLLDVLRNLRAPEAERLAPQITRPCPATRSGQPGQSTGQTASNPPRR